MPNNRMLVGVLDCDDNENQIVTELIFTYGGFRLTFEDCSGLSIYGNDHGHLWYAHQNMHNLCRAKEMNEYRRWIRRLHRLLVLKLIHRNGV